MIITAIDPGTTKSAVVNLSDWHNPMGRIGSNEDLLVYLRELYNLERVLIIEMIASYGMTVGHEVFETCVWIGRFREAWESRGGRVELMYRKDVKLHLCGVTRAKDANIRQALIDRYGPGKEKAIGLKKTPGPLYGFKADMWAALGVAVTYQDRQEKQDG